MIPKNTVIELYKKMTAREVVVEMQKQGVTMSESSVWSIAYNDGLRKGVTDDEREFFECWYLYYDMATFLNAFELRFGYRINAPAAYERARKIGLSKGAQKRDMILWLANHERVTRAVVKKFNDFFDVDYSVDKVQRMKWDYNKRRLASKC